MQSLLVDQAVWDQCTLVSFSFWSGRWGFCFISQILKDPGADIRFLATEITFKVVVITSSVAKITL